MNCKRGDLAIVVRSRFEWGRRYIGMIVRVLELAPKARFQMPDGAWHEPGSGTDWIVEVQGSPVDVPLKNGLGFVKTVYATANDVCLKPLPGVPVHDEEEREVSV